MSIVFVTDIKLSNNSARFSDPYNFKVTLECTAAPTSGDLDLEWHIIYVSSPDAEDIEQELDTVITGPIPLGKTSFELYAPPPDHTIIPAEDVIGISALILTVKYKDQEFLRVIYYQNTEYDNEEMNMEPPEKIQFERLVRELASKPKVTASQIKW